jgi:hypothetical protein
MTSSLKPTVRHLLVLVGVVLLVAGCSQDEMTSPVVNSTFSAEDPLDDALKSLDGRIPTDPQDRLARIAEVLGLDEDQLAALAEAYTIFRDGMADLQTQVRNGDMTLEEAREAALVLREAFEAECQVILTAEQWDLLQAMRDEGRQRMGHNHQHRNAHDLWSAWLTEIGADEAQVTAILEALATLHTGMVDLRDQVREGTLTREEAFEVAATLRADFDAALQTILTEDQYQALQDLRTDCGGPRHR